VRNLDFGVIGFGIVAIFVASWTASTLIYRWKRYDSLPIQSATGTDA
jgi:high-affinity nickel-transport protein